MRYLLGKEKMTEKLMKVGIYARVSTKKDEQNPETQLIALQDYCKKHQLDIVDSYVDRKTGRNVERPEYKRMLKDAMYHRFDRLIVWKMDRLSRGKIREVLNIIHKIKSYNVDIVSITEPFLSTDNPSSDLILSVMAWCANIESERIGERVSSGISRWEKEHGKRWHSKEWDIDKAMMLREQGKGWRAIEKELRADGYDITYAGIRKELLKRGYQKGVNLPTKKKGEFCMV